VKDKNKIVKSLLETHQGNPIHHSYCCPKRVKVESGIKQRISTTNVLSETIKNNSCIRNSPWQVLSRKLLTKSKRTTHYDTCTCQPVCAQYLWQTQEITLTNLTRLATTNEKDNENVVLKAYDNLYDAE